MEADRRLATVWYCKQFLLRLSLSHCFNCLVFIFGYGSEPITLYVMRAATSPENEGLFRKAVDLNK